MVMVILFDNGADGTYIIGNFEKQCKPHWIPCVPLAYSGFGGHNDGKNEYRNIFKLKVWDSDKKVVPITSSEISRICQPLVRPVDKVINDYNTLMLYTIIYTALVVTCLNPCLERQRIHHVHSLSGLTI